MLLFSVLFRATFIFRSRLVTHEKSSLETDRKKWLKLSRMREKRIKCDYDTCVNENVGNRGEKGNHLDLTKQKTAN